MTKYKELLGVVDEVEFFSLKNNAVISLINQGVEHRIDASQDLLLCRNYKQLLTTRILDKIFAYFIASAFLCYKDGMERSMQPEIKTNSMGDKIELFLKVMAGESVEAQCVKCKTTEFVIPLGEPIDEFFLANYHCDECDHLD